MARDERNFSVSPCVQTYLILSAPWLFILLIGVVIFAKGFAAWHAFVGIGAFGVALVVCLLGRYRVEITDSGINYRYPLGGRSILFGEISGVEMDYGAEKNRFGPTVVLRVIPGAESSGPGVDINAKVFSFHDLNRVVSVIQKRKE